MFPGRTPRVSDVANSTVPVFWARGQTIAYGTGAFYFPPVNWPRVGFPFRIPRTVRWLFPITKGDNVADNEGDGGSSEVCLLAYDTGACGSVGYGAPPADPREICPSSEGYADLLDNVANGCAYIVGSTTSGDPGSTTGDPGEEAGKNVWKVIALGTQALEGSYVGKELAILIQESNEPWPKLMSPPLDFVEFLGTDVLNVKIVEGPWRPLTDDADEWNAGLVRLASFYDRFARHRTVVYLDVGPKDDEPDGDYQANYDEAITQIPLACASAANLGVVYGGQVNYHSPDPAAFRSLIEAFAEDDGT